MRAIRILQEEHRALRAVLDALELVLDGQRADDRLDGELALEALEWFERFADGLHQDREELGLFPRMMARAPGKTGRILEDLMRWHAHERTRLAEMRARIEGAAYGEAWSRDTFTVAARAYIEIQRAHADCEDARLLPLARRVLETGDDELVLAEYARIERMHLRVGEPTPVECANRIVAAALRRALEKGTSLVPRRTRRPSRAHPDEAAPVGA